MCVENNDSNATVVYGLACQGCFIQIAPTGPWGSVTDCDDIVISYPG